MAARWAHCCVSLREQQNMLITHPHTYTHIYVHMSTHTYTHKHSCTHVGTQNTHICTHMYTHTKICGSRTLEMAASVW